MSDEEELAFLKARLGELSPAVLRQLKRDIVAEKKRRETEAEGSGGHLGEQPAAPIKPSGTLNPTAKFTSSAPVPAASKEAASRRTSPGAPGDVSGPCRAHWHHFHHCPSVQSRSTRGATQ
jgi:hypothetical protein